ncbi:MAG: hypothetical protein EA422_01995, partial [Gemmatimonadales bacterium]
MLPPRLGPWRLVLPLILSAVLWAPPSFLEAQETEVLEVPGLERPVEILIDAWGIPRIFAETE